MRIAMLHKLVMNDCFKK